MKRTITRLILTALVVPLAACGTPKGGDSDTISGTSGTSDDTPGTISATSTSGGIPPTSSASVSTTTAPATTEPADPSTTHATGDSEGTTAGTSTGSTTGGECMIEQPDPGSCNRLTPGGGRPGELAGVVDDEQEVLGATSSSGGGFIMPPEDLGGGAECDLFDQDCPDGEKCNSWSSDGDSSWDATKCVPVVPNPDPIGGTCATKGGGTSGIDSCAKGAMCWDVDEQTGQGTCVEICTCSPDNPICTTPNTTCLIGNNNSLVLCLPVCDPLDPNSCGRDDVCVTHPAGEFFICVFDASGEEGQAGDACEFINACDGAHACVTPEIFPGCDINALGCCAPFCSITGTDCPEGTSCTPWFEEGQAPKCFEDVGICTNM